jgi:hypothetical protein
MVIYKFGKRGYKVPLSYRPISLLPYIRKIMENIIAKQIAKYVITIGAVPKTQLGR